MLKLELRIGWDYSSYRGHNADRPDGIQASTLLLTVPILTYYRPSLLRNELNCAAVRDELSRETPVVAVIDRFAGI